MDYAIIVYARTFELSLNSDVIARNPHESTITERRNPRAMNLDNLGALDVFTLINDEDAIVASAVREELPEIARTVEVTVARLFYFGASTSGRVSVLDASELSPTFGPSTLLAPHTRLYFSRRLL